MTTLDDTALIEAATRRQFLTGVGVGGLLTACAANITDTPSGPTTKPFTHAMGTTEVPVAAQRIVALGSTFTAWQLATLGVYPIVTSGSSVSDPTQYIRPTDPAAADALDGIVSVAEGNDFNLEQIASLGPDLIIGGDFNSDVYAQLSAIAPTVLIDSSLPNDRFFGVQYALADLTGTLPSWSACTTSTTPA